jgi:hypothetical protein
VKNGRFVSQPQQICMAGIENDDGLPHHHHFPGNGRVTGRADIARSDLVVQIASDDLQPRILYPGFAERVLVQTVILLVWMQSNGTSKIVSQAKLSEKSG